MITGFNASEISPYCRKTNVIVFGGNKRVTVNRTLDRQTGIQVGTEICELQ
jgi:hypothetical protein